MMDDEINLREYLDLLARRWRWIVGLTLVAALVGAGISLVLPATYEASATVFVAPVPTGVPVLSPQTQLAILQEQDLRQRVAQVLDASLSADEKRALARGEPVRVLADPVDKTLFKITARANTAQKATDIANTWAGAGSAEINEKQIKALGLSIQTLQQRVELTAKDLQSAEEELKRRQRDLQVDLLKEDLARVLRILDSQSGDLERVKAALVQAQTLKQQVQQDQVSLTPEMLLNLQAMATTSDNTLLIQPGQIPNLNKQQQLAQLDALISALNGRQQALSASVENVKVQSSNLQQQLDSKQAALIEPTRVRDTVRGYYDSATTQLREAQARSAQGQNLAQAIPAVVPPDSPVEPKKTQITAIAAVVGLFISVVGILIYEYFNPRPASVLTGEREQVQPVHSSQG